MKKTASAAKKLLLSTERVRSLDPAAMRTVMGGAAVVACGATAVVCANYTNPPPPQQCPISCTIGGITTVRCLATDANR